MPDWVGRSYEDAHYRYFTGSASEKESFELAKETAMRGAVSNILEYFGYTASSKFNKIMTESSKYLMDELKGKTKTSKLIGLQVSDIYFEKYLRGGGGFAFTVHVLLKYEKQELDSEKRRLKNAELSQKEGVQNLCAQAEERLKEGYAGDALNDYSEALDLLEEDSSLNKTTMRNISSSIAAILGSLKIDLLDGPEKIAVRTKCKVPFRFKIYFLVNGERTAARGCIVKAGFIKGEGSLSDNTLASDEKGEVRVLPSQVRTVGANLIRVALSPGNSERLASDYSDLYSNVSCRAGFTGVSAGGSIDVNLSVRESVDGRSVAKSPTAELVKSKLESFGMRISGSRGASIKIESLIEYKEEQNSAEGLYAFTAICNVDITGAVKDNNPIHTQKENLSGFGLTKEQALEEVSKKVSVFISEQVSDAQTQ